MLKKKITYKLIALGLCCSTLSFAQILEPSMIMQAQALIKQYSHERSQWLKPYMKPAREDVLQKNNIWLDVYPAAISKARNKSVLSTLSQARLLAIFKKLGIKAIHTGPVMIAGERFNNITKGSSDGGFDPISFDVASSYGGDQDYKQLVQAAEKNNILLLGDLIPGHTGRGKDFELALKNIEPYRSLYIMIDLPSRMWSLLPPEVNGEISQNLSPELVEKLARLNLLPGHLERVLFSVPGKESSGWDLTNRVKGKDGKYSRYAYLHYFKPGQPTLNWLSPTFAAQQLISGQILKQKKVFGVAGFRIDANPFLGMEKSSVLSSDLVSESTSLAVNTSNMIAQLIRKLGGFSFQELNVSLSNLKNFSKNGPDFSYDFITRPGLEHALLTGDTNLLNLSLDQMLAHNIDPKMLVHGLQNHDEITYELVEYANNNKKFNYGNQYLSGKEIYKKINHQWQHIALKYKYNGISGNGLCTTLSGLLSSRLGINNLTAIDEQQREKIKKGMVLAYAFNAFLPGIVMVSAWDLVGALPLEREKIKLKLRDGDERWINRGAYQLLSSDDSDAELPKANALFGNLDKQMLSKDSFVKKMIAINKIRDDLKLAQARLLCRRASPKGVTAFVVKSNIGLYQLAFNFSDQKVNHINPMDYKINQIVNGSISCGDSREISNS